MEENKKKSVPTINIKAFFSKENLPLILLICFGIFVVASIIISALVFDINVVVSCIIVILEAALAACLSKIPIWVHGLVFIAQVVCGIIASQVPFMVLMAFIYVFAVVFLFIWANHE